MPADSCIEWQKWIDKDGYGRLQIPGTRRKAYAHRYMYEQERGVIPHGMVLDHICKNRRCINLNHLEVVTPRENTLRGKSTKLTQKDVEEIRAMYKKTNKTQTELAVLFGINQSQVSRITTKERWS